MSATENRPVHKTRNWRRFWLKAYLSFVVLGVIVLTALAVFADQLAEASLPYMESGVWNITLYAFLMLAALGGVLWILFFSARRWYTRLALFLIAVLAIASPLVLFEPVFGGGLTLRGLRPRFWRIGSVIEKGAGIADLRPESSADFPQFFGTNRNGIVDGLTLDDDWQQNPPRQLWKKPIGPAWSGFATRNSFAVTMQQDGSQECVSCYRVDDGQLVWNYAINRRHENVLGGVGPRSTPTIFNGRVFALGAVGDLSCLDGATGELVWHVDLLASAKIPVVEGINGRGEKYQIEQSSVMWGRAASPLIYKDLVIVPLGGTHTLAAFDQETGKEVWKGGQQSPGYSSPVIAHIAGEPQIVIVNESSVSGHDPTNGDQLWIRERLGSSSGDANTAMAIDVGLDQILVTKGYGMGGELIRLSKDENGTFSVTSIWKSQQVLKTKLTNAVVRDGFAYAISNEVLECVELKTGKRRWRAPERFGHGQILLIGQRILVHTENGYLVLCDASSQKYREYGRIKTIDGVCWNTIGMFGDKVLVRSDSEAACFQLPVSKAVTPTPAAVVPPQSSEPSPVGPM